MNNNYNITVKCGSIIRQKEICVSMNINIFIYI